VDFIYPNNLDMEKRRLVTQDVNAAIEGALAAGAETIYVNDTHPPERTILIEQLNRLCWICRSGTGSISFTPAVSRRRC
jgi:D-aminopeptidase